MSNAYATSSHLHIAFPRLPQLQVGQGLALFAKFSRYLSHRRTIAALKRLDARILADLGVPHDPVSVETGALERFPDIIRIRNGI